MNVFARFVVVAGLASLLWGACGGDDDGGGGDDRLALCNELCEKFKSTCFGDAGGTINCASNCNPPDGGSGGGSCSNESQIVTAIKACLEKTACQDLLMCTSTVPRCEGGSGAG
jgi:hypothetical protein